MRNENSIHDFKSSHYFIQLYCYLYDLCFFSYKVSKCFRGPRILANESQACFWGRSVRPTRGAAFYIYKSRDSIAAGTILTSPNQDNFFRNSKPTMTLSL